ncbi:peptide ligase PGM1-related protein [Actinokineospora auranticolor]|uniref:peptide ligase PGM1-related protein n=1 Tax=Actinokineospora auranticolor TaxID=155976 RepID=UPI001FEA1D76|nr:peptide ligase PGM1-related protein [Actinokineospora auranticolor]
MPSLTLDSAGLAKLPGANHYEERMLFLLQSLRDPGTEVTYVTSAGFAPEVVDYALDLVPALPRGHARRRLTMLDCASREPVPLTAKLLRRPDLLDRVRAAIPDPRDAVLVAYNGSPLERTLAETIGIPLYAPDPDHSFLGSKTGARRLFAEAGVPVVEGFDGLRDTADVVAALAELRARDSTLGGAIVKLNESFGAGGNVLFSYAGAPPTGLADWVRRELPVRAVYVAPPDTWENYSAKLDTMGGVVERFVQADEITSPSAQVMLSPDGTARVVSTHDQLLEGDPKQIFVGCVFPSNPAYRLPIQTMALRVAHALAARGVVGIASVDFVSARTGNQWRHYALEINLRMGGGTAPYFLLHGLVEGEYDPATAAYYDTAGAERCYFASDRVYRTEYQVLSPTDVIDTLVDNGLHYRTGTRTGAVAYMLGALEIGRFGIVVVDETTTAAEVKYRKMLTAINNRARAKSTIPVQIGRA